MKRRDFLQACVATSSALGGLGESLKGTAAVSPNVTPQDRPGQSGEGRARWWKGNLHMHTLWSDGDDFPEFVVAWYKQAGYHFLGLSEHRSPFEGQLWKPVAAPPKREDAMRSVDERIVARYRDRFGNDWVEERQEGTSRSVRIKPLSEFRTLFEEPQRFLLIPSQEIQGKDTPQFAAPFIDVTNSLEAIPRGQGSTPLECLQSMLDNIAAYSRRTGQHVLASLNHPNYMWASTAEEIAQTDGLRFMEIYTGLSFTYSQGDALRASAERIWDIVLTKRLAELKKPVIYGIAVDDCHTHVALPGMRDWGRPGKGWVMVRSQFLTPESIIQAMERGDFYASTGVALKELGFSRQGISLALHAEPGVTYKTQFIGTWKGYDSSSEPVVDEKGNVLRTTRRYSPELGGVLAEVSGSEASYRFKGNEIYVRARVISSKPHPEPLVRRQEEIARELGQPLPQGVNPDPYVRGEFQMAWTQPASPG